MADEVSVIVISCHGPQDAKDAVSARAEEFSRELAGISQTVDSTTIIQYAADAKV